MMDQKLQLKTPRYSVAFLFSLVTVFAFFFGWLSWQHQRVTLQRQAFEELRRNDVFVEALDESSGYFERIVPYQLKLNHYRARLGYQQNKCLYELSKLERLVELDVTMDRNPTNLMAFDGLTDLKVLRISEWYNPETLDGVQAMVNLKVLEIYDAESTDKIDLTALANHPKLESAVITGQPLDSSANFQKWERDR